MTKRLPSPSPTNASDITTPKPHNPPANAACRSDQDDGRAIRYPQPEAPRHGSQHGAENSPPNEELIAPRRRRRAEASTAPTWVSRSGVDRAARGSSKCPSNTANIPTPRVLVTPGIWHRFRGLTPVDACCRERGSWRPQVGNPPAGASRRYENPRDAYDYSIRQIGVSARAAVCCRSGIRRSVRSVPGGRSEPARPDPSLTRHVERPIEGGPAWAAESAPALQIGRQVRVTSPVAAGPMALRNGPSA